jgi:ribose-phosphate pyrophosphokinase
MDLTSDSKIPQAEFLFFPGGEPHVKLETIEDDQVFIRALIPTWEHFGELMVLLNALYHQDKVVTLFLPYFPGARQDRNPNGNTPLTVEMYAKILAPYVHRLIVFDLHSNTGGEILSKYFDRVVFCHPFQIPQYHFPVLFHGIIAPDKGAVERASLVASRIYNNISVIQCEKVRDFDSGKITGFTMDPLPYDPYPTNYLVVDDICDGGWTFNELAKAWEQDPRAANSKLYLYVSHGIFSKGVSNISPTYEKIITTDSFYPQFNGDDRVHVIPLEFITQWYLQED